MEGVLLTGLVLILAGCVLGMLFAIPTGIVLWLIGRLFGRLASVVAGSALILCLAGYGLSAHSGCQAPEACDSPGMLLFAPLIYLGIPASCLATIIILIKLWHEMEPPAG